MINNCLNNNNIIHNNIRWYKWIRMIYGNYLKRLVKLNIIWSIKKNAEKRNSMIKKVEGIVVSEVDYK